MESTVVALSAKASVLFVTPDMASRWLELNFSNRVISPAVVKRFVRIIQSGQFKMTGEGIQFEGSLADGTASLKNGQHRLLAIAQTGVGQWLVVVEGIEANSQLVMDSGRKRSFGDALHLQRGVVDASAVAALVKLGYLYDAGRINTVGTGGGNDEATPLELLTWFDAHPEVKGAQVRGKRAAKHTGFNKTACGLARLLFDRVDPADSELFFSRLESGVGYQQGDPLLVARQWIQGKIQNRTLALPRPSDQAAVLIKAWNDRRNGRTRKQIKYNRFDEAYPTPV